MSRFLAISGAAILALVLVGGMPALLRRAPPAVSALVMPPVVPGARGHDPCEDGCAPPLAWLDDGWALLSDWPGRAELRADGRRGKPATRL
ncbi:hypothetical protein GXW71_05355 [Roseomonas hellenica]|uniref:Uncharacterized protein n=1 Tax=Plastoroseomonas hellenica TaxID=2687306 RepID=A0ABS5EUZ6_9PROT|nr:hypothetical protein [Plastoroseomonas hellenica]MBR0663780.1 hypothetical protein [Plastoroseomonas hellenica]